MICLREEGALAAGKKTGVAVNGYGEDHGAETKPGAVGLRPADVGEVFAVEALGF